MIDPKTYEIRPEDDQVYSKLEDLADELPDSSPRFILLSYPLTLVGNPPPLYFNIAKRNVTRRFRFPAKTLSLVACNSPPAASPSPT